MSIAAMSAVAAKATWYASLWDWVVGPPLQIILIVVIALIAQFVTLALIKRTVRHTIERAELVRLEETRRNVRTAELGAMIMNQRTVQRAGAVGSLLRSVMSITIWVIAVLMILETAGVNIAPLLASAGVVGVALGFGAQTLVKDYLSGIFLIIEDQFGVGDVVDLGSVIGTVEMVALRYTRLRDMSGVVWYVRNGEILRVANRSQGWTMATVDIPVSYDSDLDRVRDLVEAVAIDMDDDPAYDSMLLSKPTFVGVESVSGEAVVVRISAKAVPEMQIPLVREIRERMKLAFDRAGIVVPVMVRPMAPPPTPGRPAQ